MMILRYIPPVIALITVFSCEKEIQTKDNIDTESWTANVDGGIGSGNWIFKRENNKEIYVSGEWICTFDLGTAVYEIKCPFTNGLATVFNQDISFSASGTAEITGQPGMTSNFSLNVTGEASNGAGNGEYSIIFTEPLWPPKQTGTWVGSRVSGAGITQ